jgi:DNA-binding transcriptional MerR regulator
MSERTLLQERETLQQVFAFLVPFRKFAWERHPNQSEELREGASMAFPLNGAARVSEPQNYEYTIGDLAREFGVTLRTLRFYEDKGLLSPRREGRARIYDSRGRSRLSIILKAKQLGFTLTEIQALVAHEDARPEAADLRIAPAVIDEQISHLERQYDEIVEALSKLKAMRADMCQAA